MSEVRIVQNVGEIYNGPAVNEFQPGQCVVVSAEHAEYMTTEFPAWFKTVGDAESAAAVEKIFDRGTQFSINQIDEAIEAVASGAISVAETSEEEKQDESEDTTGEEAGETQEEETAGEKAEGDGDGTEEESNGSQETAEQAAPRRGRGRPRTAE